MINRIFCFIIFLFFFQSIYTQVIEKVIPPKLDTIKLDDLGSFIYPRLKIGRDLIEKDLNSKVSFNFKVLKNGNIDSIQIVKSDFDSFEDEVIRVLELSNGMWTPATKNNKPVIANVAYEVMPWFEKKGCRKIKRILKKARTKEKKERYSKALIKYQKILAIIPYDNFTKKDIARMHLKLNEIELACKALENCDSNDCIKLKDKYCK